MATEATPNVPAPPDVRVLTSADLARASEVLAQGFAEEPGNVALFPDPQDRRSVLEAGGRQLLERAIRTATAHGAFVDGDLGGIALWDPPGRRTGPTEVARGVARLAPAVPVIARGAPHLRRVVGRHLGEAIGMTRQRASAVRRASHGASWHLAYLATAPEYRGRGLARQLLDRQLARCDADGLAVWLETTDPVNPPIYERFGFVTVAHVEDAAWLPGLWVMRREPGGDHGSR